MIDINLLRKDPDLVKKGIANKGYNPELVDKVIKLDQKYRELLVSVEALRAERNTVAKERDIEKGKEIKEKLSKLEPSLEETKKEFEEAFALLPNLPSDQAPVGQNEEQNKIIKEGKKREFSFKPKDHLELGTALDILDFERGAKVAGADFYYLKKEGALLELALVRYGLDFLMKKGFTPIITPDLARERFYLGTGYLPKGPEAQTYKIENSDLGLIATAEVTLAGYHADEILSVDELPKKYAGYSHCFRMESGGYGKFSKGMYRVHQFTKLEMFAYTLPAESEKMHQEFLQIEEEFWTSLGIPFRVLEMCTGDLGAQAARKFDLEAWMSGRGDWGEITSTSNTTDYQSRNLNLKYRTKEGKGEFLHTLNGTLVATSRGILSILENYQKEDGSVEIPEVLRSYVGGDVIASKKD